MNESICYRPYRSHGWFLFFEIACAVFCWILAGVSLPEAGYAAVIFSVLGLVCGWLVKILYDSSNITVLFEAEGLRITGGRHRDYRHIPWEKLPYAYTARSFKGFPFLVLSPRVLNPEAAKRLANRGANSMRICVDGAVVIHLDQLQDLSGIKECVERHTEIPRGSL